MVTSKLLFAPHPFVTVNCMWFRALLRSCQENHVPFANQGLRLMGRARVPLQDVYLPREDVCFHKRVLRVVPVQIVVLLLPSQFMSRASRSRVRSPSCSFVRARS